MVSSVLPVRRVSCSRSFSGFVLATFLGLLLTGCGADPVAAPQKYTGYTATDKSFACQQPEGWKKEDGGMDGLHSFARFTNKSAVIEIATDMEGSLMADISKANNAQMENVAGMVPGGGEMMAMPKQIPPIEKLHKAAKAKFEKKYGNYEEQAMKTLQTGLGEGRYSEWTGEAGDLLKYKAHGYRATILSGERRVLVTARSREEDWATLKPAFEKVIGSLANGGG